MDVLGIVIVLLFFPLEKTDGSKEVRDSSIGVGTELDVFPRVLRRIFLPSVVAV